VSLRPRARRPHRDRHCHRARGQRAASLSGSGLEPQSPEPGLSARFVPLGQLHQIDLRPPIAGHLRGLHNRGAIRTAAYLGNLWRPHRYGDVQPTLVELLERRRSGRIGIAAGLLSPELRRIGPGRRLLVR